MSVRAMGVLGQACRFSRFAQVLRQSHRSAPAALNLALGSQWVRKYQMAGVFSELTPGVRGTAADPSRIPPEATLASPRPSPGPPVAGWDAWSAVASLKGQSSPASADRPAERRCWRWQRAAIAAAPAHCRWWRHPFSDLFVLFSEWGTLNTLFSN